MIMIMMYVHIYVSSSAEAAATDGVIDIVKIQKYSREEDKSHRSNVNTTQARQCRA